MSRSFAGELRVIRDATVDIKADTAEINVADREQLAMFTPPPSGWFVLVTSGNRLREFGTASRDVSCLLRSESVELRGVLLRGHTNPTPEELDALAEACADHTKTLRVAASDAVESELAAGDLATQITAARQAWPEGRSEADRALDAFEATIGLSLSRLSDTEGEAWRACSVFAGDFDAPAGAAVLELENEAAAKRLLGSFAARCLLERDRVTGRFRMDDLLRAVASRRVQERDEADRVFDRFASYYIAFLHRASKLYGESHDLSELAVFDREANHFETLRSNLLRDDPSPTPIRVSLLCSLASAGAYLYRRRLAPDDLIRLWQVALDASEYREDELAVADLPATWG